MKRKTYKDRDHSKSKKAKSLRREFAKTFEGKPTNVGDPSDKSKKVS
jgi:hypothetical protein